VPWQFSFLSLKGQHNSVAYIDLSDNQRNKFRIPKIVPLATRNFEPKSAQAPLELQRVGKRIAEVAKHLCRSGRSLYA
jgi:hypothetical protein